MLSVKKVVANGCIVTFSPSTSHITLGNSEVKLPLRPVGNLFELRYYHQYYSSASGGGTEEHHAFISEKDEQLWHKRLGHRNMANVRELSKMDVGLPANLSGGMDGPCDVCEVGKHTYASFPSAGEDKEPRGSRPMEVVHADLIGPIDTPSMGGARYGLLFTCDYSRWRTIYFMGAKSESLRKLKEFKDDVSGLLQGCKIGGIHSDNGGEFIGEDFKVYCKRNGILQTYSAPKAPQQNGIAERSNRTVADMARCLRIEAGLGKEFWAEACNTSVHILNRVPSAILGGQTPYHKLFGKQARVDHLRVFGCRAYVQVYEDQRGKMDPKAWKGILVGYDEHNRRCYRVYDPVKRITRRAIHVTFNENLFPAKGNHAEGFIQQPVDPPASRVTRDRQQQIVVGEERVIAQEEPRTVAEIRPTATESRDQSNSGKKQVRFNLLPTGSSLLPRRDNAGNNGSENKSHTENDSEATGQAPADSVGDGDDPYRRMYNPPARGEQPRWCQDEECGTRGIHRAHLGVHFAYEAAADVMGDPGSYGEAMQSTDSKKWKLAAEEEYQSLIKNNTWTLCEKPPGANIVGTRWVFKAKRDENGNISRYKAKLVAQGFKQKAGLDYGETFAPTAKQTSIRVILAMAAQEDWHLHNMDVDTAFLNANIEEEIYISQPEGFEQSGPNDEQLVCRLNKSIYGLKQAARDWNKTLDHWMKSYGLEASEADACVYTKRVAGDILIVLTWVDDLIIAGSYMRVIDEFKVAISKRFKMKDLGELKWILGMEIKRDRSIRRIEISQAAYIKQMLERFGMGECKAVGTPGEGVLTRSSTSEGGKPNKLYMSIVGSLLYAAMMTRVDIVFQVQALSRHLQSSKEEHMVAAKRVLRYLQGTKDLSLVYEANKDDCGKPSIVGFSDADWGGDHDTRRSTTGYLFKLGGGAVSWASKLQPTVALSSAEAEYMAVCAAVQEAIHLRQLMKDIGYTQGQPTIIFEDNQGCIALSANPVFHRRTKHIDIRYHFIRERIASGEIELRYISTEHQLADILTKALPRLRINSLRHSILGA